MTDTALSGHGRGAAGRMLRASFITIAMKALVEFNKTVTGSGGYDEAQLLFLRRVPQYEDWVGWREGGREGGGRGAGGAGERERWESDWERRDRGEGQAMKGPTELIYQ